MHPDPAHPLSLASREKVETLGKNLVRSGATHAETTVKGQIRLIQAYLRVFGYFGNPEDVPGISVVTGTMNPRTQDACNQFFTQYGEAHGLRTATPNTAMLNVLRARNTELTSPLTGSATTNETALLDKAFNHAHMPHKAMLEKLHPRMRFPMAAALRELEAQGVAVNITEGYRSPQMQEGLVASGKSVAPPNWSFHNYGLAVDIVPRSGTMAKVFDKDSGAWKAIFKVMKHYGFDSMYKNKGWDLPHFELPMKTPDMKGLAVDVNGWKIVPEHDIPGRWKTVNREALKDAPATTNSLVVPLTMPWMPARASVSR